MSTSENPVNPEVIWAFRSASKGDMVASVVSFAAMVLQDRGDASVEEYVRKDVVKRVVDEKVETETTALRRERDAAEARARALAEHAGAVEHGSIADGETIATLRRERDALRLVVDAVAAFTAHDFVLLGAQGIMRLTRQAKETIAALAAGKGVG